MNTGPALAEVNAVTPMSQIKTVNLALQGGGAHRAFTWGVLDRLLKPGRARHWRPQMSRSVAVLGGHWQQHRLLWTWVEWQHNPSSGLKCS